MAESLVQALALTGIGMGMTFAAIGVLVLGMYLMTALIKDRQPAGQAAPSSASVPDSNASPEPLLPASTSTALYKAAAAAVAVALAELPQAESTRGWPLPVSGWSESVRAQHLAGRQRYDLRRARR